MYRPSKYNKHNESLENFAKLFNDEQSAKHIVMEPIDEETYDNDGKFVNIKTGEEIGFDWEYRDRYFSNGVFSFDSLGQYERKLIKKSIQLSIQCDNTQTAILVAWHEDFLLENKVKIGLATDSPRKQYGGVRYTKRFKIYSYQEIKEFKKMIEKAFTSGDLNASIF